MLVNTILNVLKNTVSTIEDARRKEQAVTAAKEIAKVNNLSKLEEVKRMAFTSLDIYRGVLLDVKKHIEQNSLQHEVFASSLVKIDKSLQTNIYFYIDLSMSVFEVEQRLDDYISATDDIIAAFCGCDDMYDAIRKIRTKPTTFNEAVENIKDLGYFVMFCKKGEFYLNLK